MTWTSWAASALWWSESCAHFAGHSMTVNKQAEWANRKRETVLTCPSSKSGSTVHRGLLCQLWCAPWAESKVRPVSTVRKNIPHCHIYSNRNLCCMHTLQWISTLMVSRLRLVLRTLMNSIKGRILMPCGEEKDHTLVKTFRPPVKRLGRIHDMINRHNMKL